MAIDTRAKRQNAAQVGCPLPVSVLPSGTVNSFARAQISWTYGGITINPPVGGVIYEDRVTAGMRVGVTERDIQAGGF